jgi:hypothetical protein
MQTKNTVQVKEHPEQPGRLAAKLLAATRTSNRAILVTSCRSGNYFQLMFIFKLKWKPNIIGQNMQQTDLTCIENNIVLQYQSVIWSKLI